jgi:predicted enzyme related to lactoylglutathione lyase
MTQHHKINYVEMAAVDLHATKAFFTNAFAWQFTDYGPQYCAFNTQGIDGGFYAVDEEIVFPPGMPLIVLYSDNLERSMQHVKDAGGSIVKEIFAFPGGQRFHFVEPSGNELAIWCDK